MWAHAAIRYFRRAVRATKRSGCFTCYTLKWNEKFCRAEPCRQNAWHCRIFQIYTVIMTLIVLPVFTTRTIKLLTSIQAGKTRELKVFLVTFIVTDFLWICIPYLWHFLKESNARKLVVFYEKALLVNNQIQG